MALVNVSKEFDALKRVDLSLFTLIVLHAKQDHAQDRSQVTVFLDDEL